MQKETYNFAEKIAYRTKLKEFIERNLYFRKPEDIKVLCFPGHEGLEIKEVYTPLGIPRENITGLEISDTITKQIKQNNSCSGINVINKDSYDYFLNTKEKFDIINLDYQGHFKKREKETVHNIFYRDLIRNGGVFATNFFAARESKKTQNFYLNMANYARDSMEDLSSILELHQIPTKELIIPKQKEKLKDFRNIGITEGIIDTILGYGKGLFGERVIRNPKITKILLEQKPDLNLNNKREIKKVLLDKLDVALTPYYFKALKAMPELNHTSFKNIMLTIQYMFLTEEQPYLPTNSERYAYSSGGAKMFSDFFTVEKPWYKFRNDSIDFEVEGESIKVVRRIKSMKNLEKDMNNFFDRYGKYTFQAPERIYLETLKENIPKKLKISKQDAIDFLKLGSSPKEIAENFAGFSVAQLGSLKAHITMGTYDE